IGLEEEAVAIGEVADHRRIGVPEVAGHADAGAVARLDHEAGRIGRVVQGAPGVNVQLTDGERRIVRENDRPDGLAVDVAGIERSLRQVDGDAVLASDRTRAANVVVVLVGDDDGLHALDRLADLLQPFARLARPETGIDQDGSAVALEVVGIARAAGGERGDDHARVMVARFAYRSAGVSPAGSARVLAAGVTANVRSL